VIAGQATAALELLNAHTGLDALVVPVGGGGLAAGTALSLAAIAPGCRLYVAEPASPTAHALELLASWTAEQLPEPVTGDHSEFGYWLEMMEGKVEGLFVMGQNPAVGAPNGRLERKALANLKWLVVRDMVETETASFWYDSPEVERGELSPESGLKLRAEMLHDAYLANYPQAIFEGWSLEALQARARDQIGILLAGARRG